MLKLGIKRLPVLPNGIGNDLPHNRPVLQGSSVQVLVQESNFLLNQNPCSFLGNSNKDGGINLMLRDKVVFTRPAAQVVRRDRVPERDGRVRALLTEEDHVGEVGVFILLVGDLFTENTA